MKSFIYTICFLCMSFQIYSQSINVHKTDGSTQSFAINEIDSITFTSSTGPFNCGTDKVEYEGKIYNTVLIGDQCWLKENLDVGEMILGVEEMKDENGIEKYCYDDDPENCDTYGGLYQWDEAMQYVTIEGSQGICPDGWHIPTYNEFQTLSDAVGGDGNMLKRIDQGFGDGQGNDISGFSGLLGGGNNQGAFYYLEISGYFWFSSKDESDYAGGRSLQGVNNIIPIFSTGKTGSASLRCLKD